MTFLAVVCMKLSLLTLGSQGVGDGNIISYQKIVACPGIPKDTLMKELARVLYQMYDSVAVTTPKKDQWRVQVDLKIYNRLIGKTGNPSGILGFTCDVEVREGKFRYSAHDFLFTPIKRDRYGRYKLENHKAEKVSDANFDHEKALLKKIKTQSKEYHEQLQGKILSSLILKNENKTEW